VKNTVEPDRPQMTSCMHFVCWVTKATNIHSELWNILFFLLQQWLQERQLMSSYYVNFLSCLFWSQPTFKRVNVLQKHPVLTFHENLSHGSRFVTATRKNEAHRRSFNYSVQNSRSCWGMRSLGLNSNPGAAVCLYRSTNNSTTTFASETWQGLERTRYKNT
jgi:hypothetical protein